MMQMDVRDYRLMPLKTNSFTVFFNNNLKYCNNRCTIICKSNF